MQDWTQVKKRLEDKYPTGAIPRQDLPIITGYKQAIWQLWQPKGEGRSISTRGSYVCIRLTLW